MLNAIKRLAGSRKFWVFVVGLSLPPLNKLLDLQLSSEEVVAGLALVSALILGITVEDAAAKKQLPPGGAP